MVDPDPAGELATLTAQLPPRGVLNGVGMTKATGPGARTQAQAAR